MKDIKNIGCNIKFCKYLGEKEYNGRWFCFYHYLVMKPNFEEERKKFSEVFKK